MTFVYTFLLSNNDFFNNYRTPIISLTLSKLSLLFIQIHIKIDVHAGFLKRGFYEKNT